MKTAPKSKYRATPTVYDFVRYASKAEAEYAEWLDCMVDAGLIRRWHRQPRIHLPDDLNVYVPDGIVTMLDGMRYAFDVKGMETAKFRADKRKWRRYGPMPLHVVKKAGKTFKLAEIVEADQAAGEVT